MIRKGIVSTVNNEQKTARVVFPELNYSVSKQLMIRQHIKVLEIDDEVLVAFWDNNMAGGIIIENLTRNEDGQEPLPNSSSYTHIQSMAATTWTINHNLSKYPSVTIVDSAGSVVMGEINYISENEIKVSFTAAFAGKAYVN